MLPASLCSILLLYYSHAVIHQRTIPPLFSYLFLVFKSKDSAFFFPLFLVLRLSPLTPPPFFFFKVMWGGENMFVDWIVYESIMKLHRNGTFYFIFLWKKIWKKKKKCVNKSLLDRSRFFFEVFISFICMSSLLRVWNKFLCAYRQKRGGGGELFIGLVGHANWTRKFRRIRVGSKILFFFQREGDVTSCIHTNISIYFSTFQSNVFV